MSSLVADYGSSASDAGTSDDNTDDLDRPAATPSVHAENNKHFQTTSAVADSGSEEIPAKLPLPSFSDSAQRGSSLFENKFLRLEASQSSLLERHIKLTEPVERLRSINGVKVCWNHRKGRCRFGHKCTYAHDSDLQRSRVESDASTKPPASVNSNVSLSPESVSQPTDAVRGRRKKRPGLGDSIKPGKKVMKMYTFEKGRLT